MAESSPAVLSVTGLSVSYGHISALENVSVDLFEGELVTLIGANGAGKSTFLEAIMGIHRPSGGRISLMGKDVTSMSTDGIVALGNCPLPRRQRDPSIDERY